MKAQTPLVSELNAALVDIAHAQIISRAAVTKSRAQFLSEQPDSTDADMHNANAEMMIQLLSLTVVLKLAMRDAISEIKTQDYDNATEVLEFALNGHVPVDTVSESECDHLGSIYVSSDGMHCGQCRKRLNDIEARA